MNRINDTTPNEWDSIKRALDSQTGGSHYKSMVIQPTEFISKNGLGFIEGNIIKYACRHQDKNGAEDIRKIKHYCDLLLELKYGDVE